MRERIGLAIWSAGLLFSLALVLCAAILARSFVRVRTGEETIRVEGSARKAIRSDFIIWDGSLTQNGADMATAYRALKSSSSRVTAYLIAHGVKPAELSPGAIATKTLYAKTAPSRYAPGEADSASQATFRPIAGYELSQSIEVRSGNVALVDDLSRQSTELISQGINFASQPPMYLYTRLSDLKVSMQAEAARDAYARAEQIAINSHCSLGSLRYAHMSVPQITPRYSNTGDGGVDDTTALDKKILAVVSAGYAIR